MYYIKEIMNLFNLDMDRAFRIYGEMHIDFSECSSAEFKCAATAAKKKLGL